MSFSKEQSSVLCFTEKEKMSLWIAGEIKPEKSQEVMRNTNVGCRGDAHTKTRDKGRQGTE
jgi:hypothetical protein